MLRLEAKRPPIPPPSGAKYLHVARYVGGATGFDRFWRTVTRGTDLHDEHELLQATARFEFGA